MLQLAPCCCQARNREGEIIEETAGAHGAYAMAEVVVDDDLMRGLPFGPRERMVTTFATADADVLHGEPLCTGCILQLTLGESIHEMRLELYVNGFSLTPCGSAVDGQARRTCRVWSPFSLVEKCQVKTMQHSAYWAVFKLTVFRKEGQDRCYYFATTGGNAYKERDQWVDEMVAAISNVTQSLFPPHAITVSPIPGVAATYKRIMAGYLLQSGAEDNVALLYCQLHAYSGGEAHFMIYRDEWCEHEVSSIVLCDTSIVSTRKGTWCTVFGIDENRFCARSQEEKDLWLRAVSNVKVKLMFDAPDPTREELEVFRASVRDRVNTLPMVHKPRADPLLAQVPRAPPRSPRGDASDPDPIDDVADAPPEPPPMSRPLPPTRAVSVELPLSSTDEVGEHAWSTPVGANSHPLVLQEFVSPEGQATVGKPDRPAMSVIQRPGRLLAELQDAEVPEMAGLRDIEAICGLPEDLCHAACMPLRMPWDVDGDDALPGPFPATRTPSSFRSAPTGIRQPPFVDPQRRGRQHLI